MEVVETSYLGRSCSSLYFPRQHFDNGLRLPLPSLVHQFLHYAHIHPIRIHPNIILVLVGVSILNFIHDMDLGLENVLFIYSLKLSMIGKFSFCMDSRSLQLVMGFPNMNKNVVRGNVIVLGN